MTGITTGRRRCVFQDVDYPERGTSPGSSTPWAALLALVGFVGMGVLVALVAAEFASGSGNQWYGALAAPPGRAPAWAFGPAWTAIYILAGVAAWRVWRRIGASARLRLWGWQLALAALWAPVFFGLHSPTGGILVLATLWPVLLNTIRSFRRVESAAATLMLPSAAVILYTSCLTVGFWWLN